MQTPARMTIETLHPDIANDLAGVEYHDESYEHVVAKGRKPVQVIDPSPGIWGGDPIEGLVTVIYECPDPGCPHHRGRASHTHAALYGPKLVATDELEPGSTWAHKLVPSGEPGYELYAD